MRRHLPPLAFLLALVLVALWPLPVSWGKALGHTFGDLADHYWGTWWFGGELLAGRWPDTTNLTWFPRQLSFWHIDPVGALLALPLRVLGFPGAWNLLVLLQVLAAAVAAWAMALDLTGDRHAAVVAGAIVGTGATTLGFVHSGLSEYLGMAPVVLACWAILRALGRDPRDRPPPRGGALIAGALIALSAWQAAYYGLFTALFALAAFPGRGWRQRLVPLALMGLVGGLLAAPSAAIVYANLNAADAAVHRDNAPGWNPGLLPSTDLLTFIRPGAYYHPDTPSFGNPGILHINYLGWVGLALAVAGLRAGRKLWLPAALVLLLAAGPVLCVARNVVTIGGTEVLLPMAGLSALGPPFNFVHHPYRLVVVLLPLLGVLAALGARRLPVSARYLVAALALVEVITISPAPWPVATAKVDAPAIYEQIPDGPVLDWPPDGSRWNRRYLVWQVHHGRPIPYGINVFLGEDLRSEPLVRELLRALDDPQGRAANRDVRFTEPVLGLPPSPDLSLDRLGIRFVVLHPQALSAEESERATKILTEALGAPVAEEDSETAWAVEP